MEKDREGDVEFDDQEEKEDSTQKELSQTQIDKKQRDKFLTRFGTDLVFRHKITLSLGLFWLSICLGWNVSQLGPVLHDLQIITKTELDEASYFLTTLSFGFLLGASIAGWVFKKLPPMAIMFALSGIFSIITFIIPWCEHYILMIVLFLIRGTTRGVVDAGCNILIMKTWGVENGPYMQALHFVFAIGGIVSPLVTTLFLSAPFSSENRIHGNISTYRVNESMNTMNINYSSHDGINYTDSAVQQSTIHGAFVISGSLTLMSSLIFLYFLWSWRMNSTEIEECVPRLEGNAPTMIRLMVIAAICSAFLFYLVIEKAMTFFLTTFTVEHLKWSTERGSYASTMYWTSFALGRFIGIIITNRFRTKRILLFYTSILFLSSLGLMIATLFKLDAGIWIFVPMSGFCQSVLYPLFLSWTEEDFFKVTGKIISLFMFVGSIGSMVTPIMLGYLIQLYSPMWFPYAEVISSIILLMIYFVLLYLSFKIRPRVPETEIFVQKLH